MIEEGILKPDSKVDGMGGTYRIGNYEIKDSHPMYKMSFSEALEQSSNIVFAKNSDNLSSDKFYKYARDFGFGIFLGIDLPGEVSGILKKPSAFDASTKRFMAYGYELGATALQVVNAYATVANRGIMMRPYVIK
jgi:cell division protein FtsI (penicillin-binding protein 3)